MVHKKTIFILALYCVILFALSMELLHTIDTYILATESQKKTESPKSDLYLYEKMRKPSKNGDLKRALGKIPLISTSKDILYDKELKLYSKKITLLIKDSDKIYSTIETLEKKLSGFLVLTSFHQNKVTFLWVRKKNS